MNIRELTMRESIIFYKSFYDSIKELPVNVQAKIYSAIFEYSLNSNEIKIEGLAKSIFILIKPQLDANNKRFENGKKGGRRKSEHNQNETETEPKQNLNQSKYKPNNNVNVNVNVNENVNVNNNINNDAFADECERSEQWCEVVCMQHKIKPSDLKARIKDFKSHLISVQEQKKTVKDFKEHFSNWLRRNKESPTKSTTFNSPVL